MKIKIAVMSIRLRDGVMCFRFTQGEWWRLIEELSQRSHLRSHPDFWLP